MIMSDGQMWDVLAPPSFGEGRGGEKGGEEGWAHVLNMSSTRWGSSPPSSPPPHRRARGRDDKRT